MLHIADATAGRINAAGIDSIGLLATRYTMGAGLLPRPPRPAPRLAGPGPPEPDLSLLHDVIYQELCRAHVLDVTRSLPPRHLAARSGGGRASGIIYGCTEIDRLVGPHDASVLVFDSTRIHVEVAVEWALAGAEQE